MNKTTKTTSGGTTFVEPNETKIETKPDHKPVDIDLSKGVQPLDYKRKDADKELNSKTYYFGLLPIVNRGSAFASDGVTLCVTTGKPIKTTMGDVQIFPSVGDVKPLNDNQVERALRSIYKRGIEFRGKKRSPRYFKIEENDPSDHKWEDNQFPLGQFCYFIETEKLDKKHGGSESTWRNEQTPMETLIPRNENSNHWAMQGNGWEFKKHTKEVSQKYGDQEFHGDL